jgi:hypothetical protein
MKRFSILFALFALGITAIAEVKIPKSVYRADEFEKAKADAKAKGKPVSILYTSEKSTCPLCNNATLRAVKELNGKTVMVYFDTKESGYEKMPPAVQQAMRASELGSYIPKLAVFDTEVTNAIAYVAYSNDDKVLDKAYREAGKKIRESKVAQPTR